MICRLLVFQGAFNRHLLGLPLHSLKLPGQPTIEFTFTNERTLNRTSERKPGTGNSQPIVMSEEVMWWSKERRELEFPFRVNTWGDKHNGRRIIFRGIREIMPLVKSNPTRLTIEIVGYIRRHQVPKRRREMSGIVLGVYMKGVGDLTSIRMILRRLALYRHTAERRHEDRSCKQSHECYAYPEQRFRTSFHALRIVKNPGLSASQGLEP